MQVVYVLGDQVRAGTALNKPCYRLVTLVGMSVFHSSFAIKASAPGCLPDVFVAHEVLKHDRFHFVPQPCAGAAKIWNARLGRDTGASENHQSICGIQHSAQLI